MILLLKFRKFTDSTVQKIIVTVIGEAVGNPDKFNIHIFCPIPDHVFFYIGKDIPFNDFFSYMRKTELSVRGYVTFFL